MPSADSNSPVVERRSFATRLGAGWERAVDHLPLAAIPVLSSVANVDGVRRALASDGVHFGLAFRFPPALADLWTFVSLPSQGPGIHVTPALRYLPVLVVVQSVLVAGYLGSVGDVLSTGEYDFARNVKRYFLRVLAYETLVWLPGIAVFGLGLAAGPLALVALPAYFVLGYLFYATPYLFVVADASLGEALGRSYGLALAGGPYFSYAVGYLLFVVGVSVFATPVAVNLGMVGVVVGTALAAPVALAATFATTEFVAELTDRSSAAAAPGASGRSDASDSSTESGPEGWE